MIRLHQSLAALGGASQQMGEALTPDCEELALNYAVLALGYVALDSAPDTSDLHEVGGPQRVLVELASALRAK